MEVNDVQIVDLAQDGTQEASHNSKAICIRPIISEQAAVHLKQHKYSGSDCGLFYIYFFDPICKRIVELLPETIAPNTLTLLGFIHSVVPIFVLYSVFGTALIGDLPIWMVLLATWGYFGYRMFDEMDGKQARRTGNSSPLGLIFDHGADCFCAGIWPIAFMRVLQVGNNFLACIMMIGIYSAFHFTTLEEYYVGTLYLPIGNGVSDGSGAIILFSAMTCFVGNNFWATPWFDATWMNVEGVTVLTYGQFFALATGTITFLSHFGK